MTAFFLGITGTEFALLIGYGSLIGVLIDLDHFIIARLNTGSWSALRSLFLKPSKLLFQQESIFTGEVGKLQRLLSHMIISGATVAFVASFDTDIAVFSAVVLYVHIVSDLVADVKEIETPL